MKTQEPRKPNRLLREQRLLRGWSLPEVIHQLQALFPDEVSALSADMVSKWELGKYTPSPFYQAKLCKLYGMTAVQLGFVDPSMLRGPAWETPGKDEQSSIPERTRQAELIEFQEVEHVPVETPCTEERQSKFLNLPKKRSACRHLLPNLFLFMQTVEMLHSPCGMDSHTTI